MAQSHKELIRSAESWNQGWENRLTEIFATVVDLHYGLATKLFERFALDPGERVRVYTQELLVAGAQPDIP